jgi:hypothetical protein
MKCEFFVLQSAECIILAQFCKDLANRRMLLESFILRFPERIGRSRGSVIWSDITQDKNSIFTKSHAVGKGACIITKYEGTCKSQEIQVKKNEARQVVTLNTLANWHNTVHELLGDSTITIDEDACYLLASQESGPLTV